LVIFAGAGLGLHAANLPPWFVSLREAVYMNQLSANEIAPLARDAAARARSELSGAQQLAMLSRIEYMMGRAYLNDGREREAFDRFSEGIDLAERSLAAGDNAEAWEMLAANIARSIVVRSTLFAIRHGPRVERYSRNALARDSRNFGAQYMIASRWVFAPAPFNNLERGLTMMKAIPDESDMDDHARFNVYTGLAFAYIQLRRPAEARPWIVRALEIYPTNKFAIELLEGI